MTVAAPWRWWDAATIARITGCPLASVQANWPLIYDALAARGIADRDVQMGVLGTVSIETASTFEPIDEFPDHRRYPATGGYPPHYEGGPTFHGRGYIQLTHLGNYRQASAVVGVDLVASPERANEPAIAAEILAWWFDTKGVPAKDGSRFYTLVDLCREHDWHWVRRAVQGGTAGLDRLVAIASALDAYKEPAMPKLTYNPDAPVDIQPDDWSCSEQSAQWLLRAIGRNPGDDWIRGQLLDNGLVTREYGLMDGSGAALAAWLQREYGDEMGLTFTSKNGATWEDIAAIAGKQPMMIGGRSWNHWSGVRRMKDGGLELANPSPNWREVGNLLDRAEFDRWGSWSYITVSDGSEAPSQPPAADPRDARIAELEAALAAEREKNAGLISTLGYVTGDVADALQAAVNTLRAHKPAA
jgi:hypothetical protein